MTRYPGSVQISCGVYPEVPEGNVVRQPANETRNSFAATDFPLVVATDHNGVIRTIQPATDDSLAPDGLIHQLVRHILANWPPAPHWALQKRNNCAGLD